MTLFCKKGTSFPRTRSQETVGGACGCVAVFSLFSHTRTHMFDGNETEQATLTLNLISSRV